MTANAREGALLDEIEAWKRRVLEMAEVPCVSDPSWKRHPMKCFPGDPCSFCRARTLVRSRQAQTVPQPLRVKAELEAAKRGLALHRLQAIADLARQLDAGLADLAFVEPGELAGLAGEIVAIVAKALTEAREG